MGVESIKFQTKSKRFHNFKGKKLSVSVAARRRLATHSVMLRNGKSKDAQLVGQQGELCSYANRFGVCPPCSTSSAAFEGPASAELPESQSSSRMFVFYVVLFLLREKDAGASVFTALHRGATTCRRLVSMRRVHLQGVNDKQSLAPTKQP